MNDEDVPIGYVPLAPLEALAKGRYFESDDNHGAWSNNKFAEMVGVSNRAIGRWRAGGDLIPWASADIAAVRLGFHPMSVWPELWMALDRGLIAGTDKMALREYDAAMEEIGKVLAREREATV